ncbi:MAG: gliding motility-associated C-terminal domain-containing protein [Bacteroidetes bacterium]|nr:gliding motility-associated C-terminal domain-containing protein [Bacteroidota bacterium]
MKRVTLALLFIVIFLMNKNVCSQTWSPLSSGTTNLLSSMYFLNDLLGFAAGQGGKIIKTTDGGVTWSSLTSGVSVDFGDIRFVDVNTGYAVGRSGVILKTINGGASWTALSPGVFPDFARIFIIGNDIYVTASSGIIIKSSNAGISWSQLPSSTSTFLYGIYFTDINTGYVVGHLGTILKTVDAGATWTSLASGTSSQLLSVWFTDANNGYAVGGDQASNTAVILKTTNAGVTWSTQTFSNNFFINTRFLNNSTGYATGGSITSNTSTILKTVDGGNVWTTEATSSFRQVGFFIPSANVAFSCGLNGSILKLNNPVLVSSPDARFTSSEPGCVGQSENFYSVMAGVSGISHSWDFGSGASPATSTFDNPTGIAYSTPGAKLVTHIVSTSMGSDTVTNIITINPSPIASFSFSSANLCLGSSVNFTNTGSVSAGVTYSWDFGSGAIPAISSSQNPMAIVYETAGSKIITETVMNQFGCFTTATQTINVNSLPIADAGNDITICADSSVQIGSNPISGNSYSWFPSTLVNSSSVSNPVASPIAPVTQLIVSVTSTLTGCVNSDTVVMTMLSPTIANAGVDGEICENDFFQIGSALIEGQNYFWSPSLGLSDSLSPNPISSPLSTTTYTLTVISNGCPSISDEVTIIVHPLPIINAGLDDTITSGSSVMLNASGGLQYIWSPSLGLSNVGIYNPIASPTVSTEYIVSSTDIYGCTNVDSVFVTVIASTVWLPTAFSPDGNGSNDIFFVRGEGVTDFEFSIFNRWGEQLFYTNNISEGWDGKRQLGGEDLPQGAYVYYVKGTLSTGEKINTNGLVNLIR